MGKRGVLRAGKRSGQADFGSPGASRSLGSWHGLEGFEAEVTYSGGSKNGHFGSFWGVLEGFGTGDHLDQGRGP